MRFLFSMLAVASVYPELVNSMNLSLCLGEENRGKLTFPEGIMCPSYNLMHLQLSFSFLNQMEEERKKGVVVRYPHKGFCRQPEIEMN